MMMMTDCAVILKRGLPITYTTILHVIAFHIFHDDDDNSSFGSSTVCVHFLVFLSNKNASRGRKKTFYNPFFFISYIQLFRPSLTLLPNAGNKGLMAPSHSFEHNDRFCYKVIASLHTYLKHY